MSGPGAEPVVAPTPLVPLPARLAVLLSGRGSNFESLADACARGDVPARIVAVVSDRRDAPGLSRAEARGLATHVLVPKELGGREAQEARLARLLEEARVDVVCLAGYMRILGPGFVASFPLRILNIHPSLLPSFPGKEAQAQAVAHGVRVSGVTVHVVDAGMDSGPILAQEAVTVADGDDAASLSARILPVEHRLYPQALRRFLEGGWRLGGRRLVFPPES
ncbi:phosphoribosylglycinamide formyltransferase [Acidobacteria bacterium ACD]|nr:MAG: phosphoribosylglycinamide formyltransferase [Acidobacteriota bacterium]MDL1948761.1 phosphoribosylglycinamide formyltransferase [Acidobacteria bacterium ACD]